MVESLSYRAVEYRDFEKICILPQNAEDLFFMFPKAEYPFTKNQFEATVNSRFDSTVFLFNEELVGFANFYEVIEQQYCSIGNVIVDSNHRNIGIGEYIVKTMECIGVEKYKVQEFHVSCFNTNTKGLLLYSKLGYKPYETERRINKENKTCVLIKLKRNINE